MPTVPGSATTSTNLVQMHFAFPTQSARPVPIESALARALTTSLKTDFNIVAIHKALAPLSSGIPGAKGYMWNGNATFYIDIPHLATLESH